MIQPLALAVLAMDALSLALLMHAAWGAIRILSAWSPGTADGRQIRLERRAETVAIAAGWALPLFGLASLMLVVAVATDLPPLVPGAMCGTGVVQASRGRLGAAFILRGLALLLLYLWRVLDGIDRSRPEALLVLPLARLLLVALPAAAVAASQSLGALQNLDLHAPVSCCALVIDTARPAMESLGNPLPDAALLWPSALGALILFPLALRIARQGARFYHCAALGLLSLGWVPLAGLAYLRHLSAYVYGVPHHHCPWCLFLSAHGGIGYILLLALALLVMEGAAVWIASLTGLRVHPLREAAGQRVRLAALRVMAALGLFLFSALWPAVAWRLRFGLWLS